MATDRAKSYYEANDRASTINIVEEIFSKHGGLVSMEDINIATEIHISNKQYSKTLEIIKDFFFWNYFRKGNFGRSAAHRENQNSEEEEEEVWVIVVKVKQMMLPTKA